MGHLSTDEKILLVVVDNATRQSIALMLRELGYQVAEEETGAGALESFQREVPALVLTDLQLPQLDSLTLVAAVREANPALPVVVLSEGDTLGRALEAIRLGAWDYVEKPVAGGYLELVLRRTFERCRRDVEEREIRSEGNEPAGSGLTLLLAEDELLSREMLSLKLAGQFHRVITAKDGAEGFRLFCEHAPDIVLTDQMMPGLSGLGMMQKIRETGAKTPVVLMTSTIDNDFLLEAINSGVERFVPKPLNFDLLSRALNSISREIVNARLLEQHRQQEVERLRYRDAYNALQQESARRKERHVVRHDLHNQILPGANGAHWGINVAYLPRDIMCGDGYSVRNLFDGRQLIFVIDAMGSGISAALTAMLTTSFCNYQIDNLHPGDTFTLRLFLSRFLDFLRSTLLDEEALSCGFFVVDLVKEEIEAAQFALPPLLLREADGSVRRIRGNNPPLGVYSADVQISTLSLTGVTDLLIMTDGVTDASVVTGGSYRNEIASDFQASPTLAALQRRFMAKTDREDLDDLTLLHLRRLDVDSHWSWSRTAGCSLEEVDSTIREFLEVLPGQAVLAPVEREELELVLTEALTNAFKHGCSIHGNKERRSREATCGEALPPPLPDGSIFVAARLWRGAGTPLLIVEVSDHGPGIPPDAVELNGERALVGGRGLRMIDRFTDSIFIDTRGGELFILKSLEGGTGNADRISWR